MQHIAQADTDTYAKAGCYRCGTPGPGVELDVAIEGEGALMLCETCIVEAARHVQLARGRRKRSQKAKATA